jgi:hypothetical protein
MTTLKPASLLVATAMPTSCAAQPPARTGAFQPHFIGNVNSISSTDKRAILAFERAAILKEFHVLPDSITVRVINHNHVMVFYDVRDHQCGEPVDRTGGRWKGPGGPRVILSGSNQALQPTTGRSDV